MHASTVHSSSIQQSVLWKILMALSLDRREKSLSAALKSLRDHEMVPLPVGDVRCRYANGKEWILERKTVRDLAHSVRSLSLIHI